jgi:hypothetical protein
VAVERRKPKWTFLAIGGTAAATSAVLYGLGAASQNHLLEGSLDQDVSDAELEQLQTRNHVLVGSSAAAAGIAAAGFVTFAVVR